MEKLASPVPKNHTRGWRSGLAAYFSAMFLAFSLLTAGKERVVLMASLAVSVVAWTRQTKQWEDAAGVRFSDAGMIDNEGKFTSWKELVGIEDIAPAILFRFTSRNVCIDLSSTPSLALELLERFKSKAASSGATGSVPWEVKRIRVLRAIGTSVSLCMFALWMGCTILMVSPVFSNKLALAGLFVCLGAAVATTTVHAVLWYGCDVRWAILQQGVSATAYLMYYVNNIDQAPPKVLNLASGFLLGGGITFLITLPLVVIGVFKILRGYKTNLL